MATKPTTSETGERVNDGNVTAEEKPSHRMTLLDQIAAERYASLGEADNREGSEGDGVQGEGDGEAVQQVEVAEQVEVGSEGEEQVEAGAEGGEGDGEPGQQAPVNPDDPLVEIKVDGVIQRIPQSKLVESFQIDQAARQRMNEANAARSEANEILARAREAEAALQRSRSEPEPQQDRRPITERLDYEGFVRSVQFDDPAEGAKKVKEFVETLRQPDPGQQQFDPNAFGERMMAQISNKLEWDNAHAAMQQNYKDIVFDPILAPIAGQRASAYLQQELLREQRGERRRPFYEVLSNAADDVRAECKRRGWKVGSDSADVLPGQQVATDQPVSLSQERETRKVAAAGTQPQPRTVRTRRTTAAAAAPAFAPSEEERSRSAIDEIKRQRGQIR